MCIYSIRSAAEQFGDKKPEEIIHIITETLEGHQREIMAHMTVEEIYRYLLLDKFMYYISSDHEMISISPFKYI